MVFFINYFLVILDTGKNLESAWLCGRSCGEIHPELHFIRCKVISIKSLPCRKWTEYLILAC